MSKVLVLLATYNGATWLPAQLESLYAQSGVDISIYAADDLSNDGTRELLLNSGISLADFKTNSGGAGQNFLRLIAHADLSGTDFIAFSDQDDVWHQDKLVRAVTTLRDSGADGYSSAVTAFWPDGRSRVLSQNPTQTDLDFLFEGAGQGCSFVLSASFAREVQQFIRADVVNLSKLHYHDWLVYALARAKRKSWVFDPVPSMRYRQHAGNDTGARGALGGIQKRIGLIKNGWYALQVNLVIDAVLSVEPKAVPADFLNAWRRPGGFMRRIKLSRIVARRGRRRFSDRAILFASSLIGWI